MKKLFVASILSLFAVSAWCEPTAKAVWDANTNTFTFYYDENTYEGDGITQYAIPTSNRYDVHPDWAGEGLEASVTNVIFDASFAAYSPINMNSWFEGFTKLKSIENLAYLDTSNVEYAFYAFRNCSSLTSLDLSNFTTTSMRFRSFFQGCSKIEVLDLRSFTTVSDCRSLFAGMTSLKTILVTEQFAWAAGTSDDSKTFENCSSLVGGAGTSYAVAKNKTKEYGRIDNPPDEPGYFTYGPRPIPPIISGVTATDLTHESVWITIAGDTLNEGTITVDLVVAGGVTVKTEDLSDFGDVQFVELTPETAYSVKVTATSEYGTTINDDCAFTTPAQPADYWLYDATEGSVSWSEWTFNATLAQDGTIKIGAVTHWPEVAMALDFSRQVKDEGGTAYVISELSPAFGHHDKESSYRPAGYEPQCLRVGLLTLPGEGLVSVGQAAFAGCANAAGVLSFPSTLTSFGTSAFADCDQLRIDGSTIPGGVTKIPQYCFKGDTAMFGDVVLTNVTAAGDSAFQGSSITSAIFGPDLRGITGNYERGSFQGCKALTNVTFDAASAVRITAGYTFKGCTELEELNLGGVAELSVSADRNDYSHVDGCSKLKKIIFGAGLTNLMYNAMAGATALEEVVFEGVPPIGFQMPYLSANNSKGEHVTGYDNKKITTYVHRKFVNEKNEAGKCWADYAANGRIGAAKKDPANNTTWAAEYVYGGVDLANRPLLVIEPEGLTIIFR